MVREASMAALRECINVRSTSHVLAGNTPPLAQGPVGVGVRHFAAAFQKVKPSVNKKVRIAKLEANMERAVAGSTQEFELYSRP